MENEVVTVCEGDPTAFGYTSTPHVVVDCSTGLPFTGMDVLLLVASGLVVAAAGLLLLLLARRKETT